MKCDVDIYDGDNFSGEPIDKRVTATLKVPISFIDNISGVIDVEFKLVTEILQ